MRGGVVTEGSAGSTAISLATVASAYGCKCHVVIPDDAAIEKVCKDSVILLNKILVVLFKMFYSSLPLFFFNLRSRH